MRLQLAHGPVQEAADGLVGVLLVGGLDDEGHRRTHDALLHAAPAPLSPPPGATRSRWKLQELRAGSAASAQLPKTAGDAHGRAPSLS